MHIDYVWIGQSQLTISIILRKFLKSHLKMSKINASESGIMQRSYEIVICMYLKTLKSVAYNQDGFLINKSRF